MGASAAITLDLSYPNYGVRPGSQRWSAATFPPERAHLPPAPSLGRCSRPAPALLQVPEGTYSGPLYDTRASTAAAYGAVSRLTGGRASAARFALLRKRQFSVYGRGHGWREPIECVAHCGTSN